MDPLDKRALIKNHVNERSFVDIGGLWGTHGEMMTTAARAGASRVMMADIQEPGSDWWQKFEARCAELGVEDYEELQVDICAPEAPEKLGRFDFVHCSGVMYHVADLFQFLGNLVSVTGEYLLLSSVVMPDQLQGKAGSMTFGPDLAYLSPVLSEENHAVVVEHLEGIGFNAAGLTQQAEFVIDNVPQTGPWWWLFSGSFMARVVELYGLEILEQGPTPTGHGYTILARRTAG